jgi:arylamine N-acetyltransferase
MSTTVRFTKDQLSLYFNRICLPESKRIYSVGSLSDADQLSYLHLLQKHHLVKVPWENLTQHYSWHHVVDVNPNHLFNKIVLPDPAGENANRGGYCMEVNQFQHNVLYSLGFDNHMVGSRICRINSDKTHFYGGWTHLVNMIKIGGAKYMVDGGFGPHGPPRPIRLQHDEPESHVGPAEMRLLHAPIDQNADSDQKVWIDQYRYDQEIAWAPMYCFVELEFTPEDIYSMNHAPWLSRHTFFTHKVVAVRFTTDKEVDGDEMPGTPGEVALEGEIDGSLTINHDVLKWRRKGKKVLELPFVKEEDRLLALEKYFGIRLGEQDRLGIRGTAAEMGSRAPIDS